VLGAFWLVVGVGAAGFGWQRGSAVLMTIGAAMLALAAWNAAMFTTAKRKRR
jgi:hypothetical protein